MMLRVYTVQALSGKVQPSTHHVYLIKRTNLIQHVTGTCIITVLNTSVLNKIALISIIYFHVIHDLCILFNLFFLSVSILHTFT